MEWVIRVIVGKYEWAGRRNRIGLVGVVLQGCIDEPMCNYRAYTPIPIISRT